MANIKHVVTKPIHRNAITLLIRRITLKSSSIDNPQMTLGNSVNIGSPNHAHMKRTSIMVPKNNLPILTLIFVLLIVLLIFSFVT